MAKIRGWAKKPYNAKPRVCMLSSTGITFDELGGPVQSMTMMFERRDERDGSYIDAIEVDIDLAEAELVLQTAKDFVARRKLRL